MSILKIDVIRRLPSLKKKNIILFNAKPTYSEILHVETFNDGILHILL